MILITGGAGFIGSNFILDWFLQEREPILNVDLLTYAGNLENLESLKNDKRYLFMQGDILDSALITCLLNAHHPRAIIHFAAESHVDRSIYGPAAFIKTNVEGTFTLLEAAYAYWQGLSEDEQSRFRFLHISTDEVYGSLGEDETPSTEKTAYRPNSPYSASKAASDHLARAWHQTYGLPVIITNCSNNYGPYQFPEKLIPLVLTRALAGQSLPIYGDGQNVRDWLYVKDHCAAIRCILDAGIPGEVYNIGGNNEIKNIDTVTTICRLLDQLNPDPKGKYERLITFVKDRPGHDQRYAINASKLNSQLGWYPLESFESGILSTVHWYLNNFQWLANISNKLKGLL